MQRRTELSPLWTESPSQAAILPFELAEERLLFLELIQRQFNFLAEKYRVKTYPKLATIFRFRE